MKTNEILQKEVKDAIKLEPLLNSKESSLIARVGKPVKTFIYVTSLVGIGLLFNACMAGYVATEPVYMETARPARHSDGQIWINGDWSYNRQTRVYVQPTGYWQNPNRGRTYVSGHWQSTPRGKYWAKGHWQHNSR
jgi:hypothetical protein